MMTLKVLLASVAITLIIAIVIATVYYLEVIFYGLTGVKKEEHEEKNGI